MNTFVMLTKKLRMTINLVRFTFITGVNSSIMKALDMLPKVTVATEFARRVAFKTHVFVPFMIASNMFAKVSPPRCTAGTIGIFAVNPFLRHSGRLWHDELGRVQRPLSIHADACRDRSAERSIRKPIGPRSTRRRVGRARAEWRTADVARAECPSNPRHTQVVPPASSS